MESTIAGAVIGVCGAIAGAVAGGLLQYFTARHQIKAELQRLRAQLLGEAHARLLARKQDILLDGLADLVVATDPELPSAVDYKRVVTLIHRCQLVLDVNSPLDSTLNEALTELGLVVRDCLENEGNVGHILGAQSAVIESGRACVLGGAGSFQAK